MPFLVDAIFHAQESCNFSSLFPSVVFGLCSMCSYKCDSQNDRNTSRGQSCEQLDIKAELVFVAQKTTNIDKSIFKQIQTHSTTVKHDEICFVLSLAGNKASGRGICTPHPLSNLAVWSAMNSECVEADAETCDMPHICFNTQYTKRLSDV